MNSLEAVSDAWPRRRRGDVVTVAGGVYAKKPRPALIVQDDRFDATDSVTVCPFTSSEDDSSSSSALAAETRDRDKSSKPADLTPLDREPSATEMSDPVEEP